MLPLNDADKALFAALRARLFPLKGSQIPAIAADESLIAMSQEMDKYRGVLTELNDALDRNPSDAEMSFMRNSLRLRKPEAISIRIKYAPLYNSFNTRDSRLRILDALNVIGFVEDGHCDHMSQEKDARLGAAHALWWIRVTLPSIGNEGAVSRFSRIVELFANHPGACGWLVSEAQTRVITCETKDVEKILESLIEARTTPALGQGAL